jgi:hypothetical protein
MNDKIKEFAGKALDKAVSYTWTRLDYDQIQELLACHAELIVAECMRMCEVTEMSFVTHGCDVEASGAITVKQFIAEHFGIEE